MICPRCGDTGIETYDDTDDRGYLCTSSRPCRCRASYRVVTPNRDTTYYRSRREAVQWGVVAVLALLLGVLPAVIVGLR